MIAGRNPMDLKRGIDNASRQVVDFLQSMSKEVKNKEEIKQVGTISSNNDHSIGTIISDAMKKAEQKELLLLRKLRG